MESEGTTSEQQELPEDIQALGYEEARDQLFSIVQTLERNQSGLEESIALWERSELLARRCDEWLDGARERLDRATDRQRQTDDEVTERE
ncbi:exodeoxyribonuclease VII small subunit [Dermabacter hominis]|nr:exodeoxyribonuclease VII small subunit [Dermabacter hominis]MDU2057984.1 exodeoxyribonuclease VII small subunit [Dermabacter sp.]MCT1789229.1 exodeoxyribonuclease VII small subunit [Dermabacter hominis]MCT2056759.1 exodeoxyribonuclease VII small subunit [Dermabacter hominis]MCT2084245.1 exodeoxyribonuclease VII small subunit [Dermabacter hominis]MCT2090554.1 exodeoxyribonuclease VII small subunit [Dermabacter hominis]